jgi:hypothetical protein
MQGPRCGLHFFSFNAGSQAWSFFPFFKAGPQVWASFLLFLMQDPQVWTNLTSSKWHEHENDKFLTSLTLLWPLLLPGPQASMVSSESKSFLGYRV